jgi:glycosyltransferase involved in cell wall biosynthesis
MKIAAIRSFLTVKAGAQGAFLNMMRSLKRMGHEVDIYVLDTSDDIREEVSKEFNVTSVGFREWKLKVFAPVFNHLRAIRQFKRLAYKINSGNYDIAFIDHYYLSPLILPFIQIPKVYYCYEPPRMYYEPYWSVTWQAKIVKFLTCIVKFLDAYCVKFADLILCPSDYAREYIWKSYGLFARTNYLGVDLELYKRLPNVKKENMVLTVGVLLRHKAHDFTIRSIGLIPWDKRPKLLIIAAKGSEKERERLVSYAGRNGVNLEIKGYVSDEEFIELHGKAKVFVIAYIMEPSIEPAALAFEIPIVAVREGGARETIVHNKTGILTNRDEKEFASAIEYLLDNPEIAESMGKEGRKWIEQNFTWEKCSENLERNLEKVLNKIPNRSTVRCLCKNSDKQLKVFECHLKQYCSSVMEISLEV